MSTQIRPECHNTAAAETFILLAVVQYKVFVLMNMIMLIMVFFSRSQDTQRHKDRIHNHKHKKMVDTSYDYNIGNVKVP